MDSVDQVFLHVKQWLLSFLAGAPDWITQLASALINIVMLLGFFLTLFAAISVFERKILGRIQNRYGPNRVGPFGLLQPVADGIKMLIKEDIVPARGQDCAFPRAGRDCGDGNSRARHYSVRPQHDAFRD